MDILFSCGQCGQQMTIDSQYAGMTTNCTSCQGEVAIPAGSPEIDEAAAEASFAAPEEKAPLKFTASPHETAAAAETPRETTAPGRRCPNCGSEMSSDQAVVCLDCGHNIRPGSGGKRGGGQSGSRRIGLMHRTGRIGLAVAFAAGAALLGGLIWGGIAIAVNMELGIIAVLVGAMTGGTIRMLTEERSIRMGLIAVLLAIGGIVIGKLVFVEYHVRQEYGHMLNGFDPAALDFDDTDELKSLMLEHMYEAGELTDPAPKVVALGRTGIAPDSPEYLAALKAMDEAVEANEEKAELRVKELSEADKELIIQRSTELYSLLFLYDRMMEAGELTVEPELDFDEDAEVAELTPVQRKALLEYRQIEKENLDKVRAKFRAMPPEEREKLVGEAHAAYGLFFGVIVRVIGFIFSFGLWDIAFFLVAIAAAWRLGRKEYLGNET